MTFSNKMKKNSALAIALAASALFSASAHAQDSAAQNDFGINLKAGIVGVGFDLSKSVSSDVKVRFGYASFKRSDTYDKTDASYKGDLKIGAWNLLADYHPWNGGFRLSAGAYGPQHGLAAVGQYTGPESTIEINDVKYSSKDLSDVKFETKWSGTRPYFGLGYDGYNNTQSGGFFFSMDAGVIFSGAPSVNLTARCNTPALCNSINSNIDAELKKIRDDVASAKYLPVLQLGIGYRF